MRVLLTSEARFERTPDGEVWGPAAYGQALWSRYLDVFSSVLVVARVAAVARPSAGTVPASEPRIAFGDLPGYEGLMGLVRVLPQLRVAVDTAVHRAEALIVRSPSPVAYLVTRAAAAVDRPWGVEIVGDPDQVFAAGAYQHPLRQSLRFAATAAQRQVVRDAAAALYVTADVLQSRYPTRGRRFAASDAALDDAAFSERAPREWRPSEPFVLVTVGGLDQPFKGTDVLLDAVGQLHRAGTPVTLRIVGSGRLLPALRQQAARLGTAEHVEFLGQQNRRGVEAALDAAHLFVLPSLTEGLPRALLEAMARGLAAVATRVGGVPELLPEECLVPPRDAEALADRISRMVRDEPVRQQMGRRNRTRALDYHERLQAPVRRDFLSAIERMSRLSEARCA